MKLFIALFFILTNFVLAEEAPKPKWAKRQNTVLKGQKHEGVAVTWYLGIAESRNMNEAKEKAELDAKKTIIQVTSPSVKLFTKNLNQETLTGNQAKSKTFSHTDIVPIKVHTMRQWRERVDGLTVYYYDIAVTDQYLASLKDKKKTVPFEQAFDYSEQSTQIEDVNENYEDRLNFLDDHHLLIYRVFTHERLNTFSLGYEYSFSKKLISIEVFFNLDIDSDDANDGVYNKSYTEYNKSAVDLNIGLYRKYNRVLYLSIGYVENDEETGKEKYNGEEVVLTKNKNDGFSAGFKFRYAYDGSLRSGFQLEAKSELLSGKMDNANIDNKSNFESSFGIFLSF